MSTRVVNGIGMTLEDVLRPREVGERVVSHVLEGAKEPIPDFEAMRRAISQPATPPSVPAREQPERPVS